MIIERFLARGELQKRAETTDERDRLRHEARVLEVARHPGVVELLAVESDALRLRLVDGHPFTDLVDPSDDELTRIALAAATTLADLHDLGVAHRGLSAEHLLIDRGGQPVLCSFGRAQVGEVERHAAMADVRGLAGVVAADRVLAAAAQAGRWPSPARGFAIRLAATRAHTQRRWGFQPAARGAALASASVVVIAGAVVVGGGYPRPAPPPAAAHATPVGQAGPPRSAGQSPQRGGSAIARDGAWCPTVDRGCRRLPLPGGVIDAPSGRYRIGEPGDLLVLGRWRCTNALPALLRPATGEVWVWDRWATADAGRPARLVARIPGARSFSVAPEPSCDRLRVTRGDGTELVIRPDQPPDRLHPWGGPPAG